MISDGSDRQPDVSSDDGLKPRSNPGPVPVPDQDIGEVVARILEARGALESAHEGILALLGHAWLLQYGHLRELIRCVDQEIGAMQRLLLRLLDVLASFTDGTEPGPYSPDPRAEPERERRNGQS